MRASAQNDLELMKENCRLCEELAEVKKSSGILCKGNRLEAYRFIDEYWDLFGVRWLLQRLEIYPNAYYNYRKHKRQKKLPENEIFCIKFNIEKTQDLS